jgi:hypothetical protein
MELIKKRFSKCIGVLFLLIAIYWVFFYWPRIDFSIQMKKFWIILINF